MKPDDADKASAASINLPWFRQECGNEKQDRLVKCFRYHEWKKGVVKVHSLISALGKAEIWVTSSIHAYHIWSHFWTLLPHLEYHCNKCPKNGVAYSFEGLSTIFHYQTFVAGSGIVARVLDPFLFIIKKETLKYIYIKKCLSDNEILAVVVFQATRAVI